MTWPRANIISKFLLCNAKTDSSSQVYLYFTVYSSVHSARMQVDITAAPKKYISTVNNTFKRIYCIVKFYAIFINFWRTNCCCCVPDLGPSAGAAGRRRDQGANL